jgi:hypothetical protein
MNESRMANSEMIASTAPAAAIKWLVIDLVEDIFSDRA